MPGFVISFKVARPAATANGLPESVLARAKALQAAFMAACKDPQFLAEAERVKIEETQVVFEIDLPPALGFVEPMIAGAIRQQGTKLLEK